MVGCGWFRRWSSGRSSSSSSLSIVVVGDWWYVAFVSSWLRWLVGDRCGWSSSLVRW
ncbi:hypothetical protein ACXZ9C_11400 [Streptococcus agalactiae]